MFLKYLLGMRIHIPSGVTRVAMIRSARCLEMIRRSSRIRTKEGHEIDFLITIDDQPCLCIEVKTSDPSPSKHFAHFKSFLGDIPCMQLVLNTTREYDTADGISVRSLIPYLAQFDLMRFIKSPTP